MLLSIFLKMWRRQFHILFTLSAISQTLAFFTRKPQPETFLSLQQLLGESSSSSSSSSGNNYICIREFVFVFKDRGTSKALESHLLHFSQQQQQQVPQTIQSIHSKQNRSLHSRRRRLRSVKFASYCFISLIPLDQDHLKMVGRFLHYIAHIGENPSYIVFLSHQGQGQEEFFSTLHKHTLTSKFLLHSGHSLFLINQANSHLLPIPTTPTQERQPLRQLEDFWDTLISDLYEGEVFGEAFEVDAVLDDFSERLNFTRSSSSSSAIGDMWRSHFSPSRFHKVFLAEREEGQGSWDLIPYAPFYNPFDFVVFSKRGGHSDNFALLRPFDPWVWSALALSILSISITLVALGKVGVGEAIFWSGGFLLDTSEGGVASLIRRIRRAPHTTLLIPWFIASLVLSYGYKGSFFSFMSKIQFPPVPRTFRDLVGGTVRYYEVGKDLDNILSGIKSNSKFQGQNADDLLLAHFTTNRRRINQGKLQQLLSGFSEKRLRAALGVEAEEEEAETDALSFAILDRQGLVALLIAVMTLFSDYFVIRNEDDWVRRRFYTSHIWHARRNFLFPKFSRLIGAYEEGGIIGWLERETGILQTTFIFNGLAGEGGRSFYGFIALCGGVAKEALPKAKGLSLEKLHFILVVCGGMLAGAGILFCRDFVFARRLRE